MEVKGEKVFMRTGHYREKDIRGGEGKITKDKTFLNKWWIYWLNTCFFLKYDAEILTSEVMVLVDETFGRQIDNK